MIGVSKDEALYKIIICHGYNSSKDMCLPASQEFIEELKLYIVLLYDTAGYGESDPYPARSVKSEAFDIQELADKLHLGTPFYVIGCSMGASTIWSCLKCIPQTPRSLPSGSICELMVAFRSFSFITTEF